MSNAKEVKLVHFTVVDGSEEQVKALTIAVNDIKEKLPFKLEFLVTNDRIELHSVKYLLDELYKLYKLLKAKEPKK